MGFPVPSVFGEGSCPLVPALKARLLLNLGILRLLSQQKSFKRFGLPELVYRMKVECVFVYFVGDTCRIRLSLGAFELRKCGFGLTTKQPDS